MAKLKGILPRIAIVLFAAALAFYALCVTCMGRGNVEAARPDAAAEFLTNLTAPVGNGRISQAMSRLQAGDFTAAAAIFALVCFLGELCFQGRKRAALRRAMMKLVSPPVLAAAVVLWVIFRLNNTSLYAWSEYIGGNSGSPLIGTARTIRRDEFSAWTPMALSQEYTGWARKTSLIGNGTDVTWVSMGGLPAKDITLIFKPLYWGFLILGSDRGLSFLTVARLALLFAVSYRTALIYSGEKRGMSLAAAVILTFSPMIQWFFSQSIAEVLIFGQGMILAVYGLTRSGTPRAQTLYGLLLGWLTGCLILVGYPAWIIPMVYLVLLMSAYLFTRPSVEDRKGKTLRLLAGLVPSLILLGIVVYNSWDTLMAVRNSLYPGQRLITGGLSDAEVTGEVWNQGFRIDLASIFFPLDTANFRMSNEVDASPLLSFAPAGLLLSLEHQLRGRKADRLEAAVIAFMAFFWIFTFVRFPEWFCVGTLLSQCSRPYFPIAMCEVFLLVRARARGGVRDPKLAAAFTLGSTALNMAGIMYSGLLDLKPAHLAVLTVLYLFMYAMIYGNFRPGVVRLVPYFISCVVLMAGAFVNPIQSGLDMLDRYTLVRTLKEMDDSPGDLYALEASYPVSEVPLMAGKRCISTDQPYADLERWSAVDPDLKFRDAYNRLCHVVVSLAEEGETTDFQEGGNYLFATLTRKDLAALGVKYLVTPRSDLEDAVLVAYDEDDALFVWELEDNENHETKYAAALP